MIVCAGKVVFFLEWFIREIQRVCGPIGNINKQTCND